MREYEITDDWEPSVFDETEISVDDMPKILAVAVKAINWDDKNTQLNVLDILYNITISEDTGIGEVVDKVLTTLDAYDLSLEEFITSMDKLSKAGLEDTINPLLVEGIKKFGFLNFRWNSQDPVYPAVVSLILSDTSYDDLGCAATIVAEYYNTDLIDDWLAESYFTKHLKGKYETIHNDDGEVVGVIEIDDHDIIYSDDFSRGTVDVYNFKMEEIMKLCQYRIDNKDILV